MKYCIDDEEREVTIITMGKNDTVDDLIAAFEGREEYKVIVMDNPYLEGEYNDISDEYSNDKSGEAGDDFDQDMIDRNNAFLDRDDEIYRCGVCGATPTNLPKHKEYTQQMWEAGIDDRTMEKKCTCKPAKEIIDEWEREKWGEDTRGIA
jgi:hypothetical protein